MEMIIGMIKIMTLNNANKCTLCEYRIFFESFNCLPFSLRNHFFQKKLFFRNATRAPNSLDPDQVPYFGGPDLGSKCLQSRRYYVQSEMLQFQLMLLTIAYLGALNQTAYFCSANI